MTKFKLPALLLQCNFLRPISTKPYVVIIFQVILRKKLIT